MLPALTFSEIGVKSSLNAFCAGLSFLLPYVLQAFDTPLATPPLLTPLRFLRVEGVGDNPIRLILNDILINLASVYVYSSLDIISFYFASINYSGRLQVRSYFREYGMTDAYGESSRGTSLAAISRSIHCLSS